MILKWKWTKQLVLSFDLRKMVCRNRKVLVVSVLFICEKTNFSNMLFITYTCCLFTILLLSTPFLFGLFYLFESECRSRLFYESNSHLFMLKYWCCLNKFSQSALGNTPECPHTHTFLNHRQWYGIITKSKGKNIK